MRLLRHIYEYVPYYREIFDSLELTPDSFRALDDLRKLPLLDKQSIRTSQAQILAKNYEKKDILPNITGGSTGIRLNFFDDRKAIDFRKAINWRHMRWVGWDIGERLAQLWGSRFDITRAMRFYSRLKNIFIHRNLLLSSYEMTEQKMQEYRNKLNHHKPKILKGYGTALYLFSKFLEERNLRIHKPEAVLSSAETLYEYQKETIEKVFGCQVFNSYGCREVGSIANECREQRGLHIDSEHVIVEILDEDGNPCGPGETGEIIITDLDNYAFPFIRYRIEDIGFFSGMNCPCGRGLPLLGEVKGRIWDVIVGTNGNRLVGTFWLMNGVNGIDKFQILQEEYGKITLKLVVNDLFSGEEKQKLLDRIYTRCGEDMQIDIQVVKNIPLTKSGKHRFVISKVSPFV